MYHGESDIGSEIPLEYTTGISWRLSALFLWSDELYFLTQRPREVPKHGNILYPFDYSAWTTLGATLVGITLCFLLIARCNRLDKHEVRETKHYACLCLL